MLRSNITIRILLTLLIAFTPVCRHRAVLKGHAERDKTAQKSAKPASLSDYIRAVMRISTGDQTKEWENARGGQSQEELDSAPSIEKLKSAGQFQLENREYLQALSILSRAQQIDPTDAHVERLLAESWLGLGNCGKARTHAERATLLNTDSIVGFELLGQASLCQGDAASSLEAYRKALALAPKTLTAHVGMAEGYSKSGNLLEARHSYEKALELDPSRQDIWLRLGGVLVRLGEEDQALNVWEKVLPQSEALLKLGQFYADQGEWGPAQEFFRRSLKVDPRNEFSRLALSEARSRLAPPTIVTLGSWDSPMPDDQVAVEWQLRPQLVDSGSLMTLEPFAGKTPESGSVSHQVVQVPDFGSLGETAYQNEQEPTVVVASHSASIQGPVIDFELASEQDSSSESDRVSIVSAGPFDRVPEDTVSGTRESEYSLVSSVPRVQYIDVDQGTQFALQGATFSYPPSREDSGTLNVEVFSVEQVISLGPVSRELAAAVVHLPILPGAGATDETVPDSLSEAEYLSAALMDEESEPEKPVMAGLSAPAGRDTETFAQQSPEPDISDIERGEPGSMTAGILQPSEVPPSRPLVSEPATESVLNEYPRRRLDQSGEAEQVVATAALVPTVVTSQVPESRDSAQTLEISEIGSSEASVSGVAVKDPIPAEVDLKPGGREIPLELKFLDFGRNFQGWLIRSVPRSVWILFGFLFLFSLPLRSPRKYEA